MKKYLVRDILEAEPMPMNEYVKLVQKEVDDVPNTDGYHVKYANGKITWLEKNDFEKNAIPYDTWLERLAVEEQDVKEKTLKLEEAFKVHELNNLTPIDAALMDAQFDLMNQYHTTLRFRYAINHDKKQPGRVGICSFGIALAALKEGWLISRFAWLNENNKKIVLRQVPCRVDKETIPNMKSLSYQAKRFMEGIEDVHIQYEDQCISINSEMKASSWSPTVEDIFAEDWVILTDARHFVTKNTEASVEQGQKSDSSSRD